MTNSDKTDIDDQSLEKHFIYRLIKVFYYLMLSITFLFIILVNLDENTILLGFVYLVITYCILNIVREGLIYLAFEKKFSWDWIKPLRLFHNINNKLMPRANKIEVDPSTAAALLVQKIVLKEKPFIKPTGLGNNENIDAIIECATIGYSAYLYLLMIQNKFGKEVSKIVRENLIIILNRADNVGNTINQLIAEIEKGLIANLPYEKDYLNNQGMSDEQLLTFYILANSTTSPYYIKPEERKNTTIESFTSKIDDNIFAMLVNHLTTTKMNSVEVFAPIIKLMSFKKESIQCINLSPELIWSKNPGCFERYIERVYYNPLIDNEFKIITQELVDDAKSLDLQELHELTQRINYFYRSIPDKLDIDANNQLDKQRIEIDELVSRCYEVGGEALKYVGRLSELREKTIECWKIYLSNNKDKLEALEKAELFHKNKIEKIFNNPFIKQRQRNDSPIRNHIFELLLFEDIKTFELYFFTLSNDKETTSLVKDEIIKLVKKANDNNISIPMLKEKLEVIELNVI